MLDGYRNIVAAVGRWGWGWGSTSGDDNSVTATGDVPCAYVWSQDGRTVENTC